MIQFLSNRLKRHVIPNTMKCHINDYILWMSEVVVSIDNLNDMSRSIQMSITYNSI